MKIAIISVFAILVLWGNSLRAADEAALAALQSADEQRVAATVAGDAAKLGAVLSDELHYAHSTGGVDTKTSYIDSLTSGKLKYASYEYEERKFSLATPGVALMTGRVHVKSVSAKGPSEAVLGFLAVWREENGHWRFLAWQSNKLNSPSAPK